MAITIKKGGRDSFAHRMIAPLHFLCTSVLSAFFSFSAIADYVETNEHLAIRLSKRFTGSVPTPSKLAALVAALDAGQVSGQFNAQGIKAAVALLQNENGFTDFFTAKYAAEQVNMNFAFNYGPYTGSKAAAIIVKNIQNNEDFRKILTTSTEYYWSPSIGTLFDDVTGPFNPFQPAWEEEERDGLGIGVKNGLSMATDLVPKPMKSYPTSYEGHPSMSAVPIDPRDAGGVMTAWGSDPLYALGTNRRQVRHYFKAWLCAEIQDIREDRFAQDPVIISQIWRDVPKGNSAFLTACVKCHGGLDPLAKAFAYWNRGSGGFFAHSRSDQSATPPDSPTVLQKMHHDHPTKTGGHFVSDARWVNNFTGPTNMARFGWEPPFSGEGINEFGQMLGRARAFGKCTVTRFFEHTCKREPRADEAALIEELTDRFRGTMNYRVKQLIQEIAMKKGCIS